MQWYLRQNVQVEPLIDQWYAWSYLIPPATAARNLTERHFRIMESYIASPAVHAAAIKNPKMSGGPFIDYQGKRVEEIGALRLQTAELRRDLIELSSAIQDLDDLLRSKAHGFSLQPLYELVPDALRGYVELVYDLNGHPSFRLLESLLYASRYYKLSSQSLSLSLVDQDDRAFVLSTPRLSSASHLELKWPFADPRLDLVFKLKTSPTSWSNIEEIFGRDSSNHDLLPTFFTSERPRPYQYYLGAGIRWRYFGHACILIETAGLSILLDPVISYSYDQDVHRYTYEDLPDAIDYVLITHNHQDHVLFETLLQIRHKVKTILVPANGSGSLQDPSLKLALENCGFENVTEVRELERLSCDSVQITGIPFLGEHADLDIRSKLGWLIEVGGNRLMFAADSCNIEPRLYQHLVDHLGPVDVLFLGMECDGAPLTWLYGPLLTKRILREHDESRRLAGSNAKQGMEIIKTLGCSEVYVYAMGQEPWLNYIMSVRYTDESSPIVESNSLISQCAATGIHAERLFGEKEILIPAK